MRIWSIHPCYLDPKGLVALWREALLAQAVLRGETRGYKNHPQLERFKNCPAPLTAISLYLAAIHTEAMARGYNFDKSKIIATRDILVLPVTSGQVEYEWAHLMEKLQIRCPELHQKWESTKSPMVHPLFHSCVGDVEIWERQPGKLD